MTPTTDCREANKRAAAPGMETAAPNTARQRHIMSHTRTQGELPQFLRDLLASPPRHGEGVHQWLFRVARQLHAHRDEQTICDLLAAATDGCGRRVPQKEIEEAVQSARACAWQPSGTHGTIRVAKAAPKWPERDHGAIRAIVEADPGAMAKLCKASRMQISDRLHDAECLLERLFPGDPLLCVADGVASARVLHRTKLRGLCSNMSHIVPSPMSKPEGINKQGRPSRRCLDNTGPRHYLVTEFDQGDKDTQAAVIRHLTARAPLVMVVDSGGKSLHAWWRCFGQPEDRLRTFFRHAVALGADPATWTRCQLVRMPLGWRPEKGKRQEVLFYDFTATVKGGAA